jgi:hypothetical protein
MFAIRTLVLRSLALAVVTAAGILVAAPANAQYYTGSVRNNLGVRMSYQYQVNGGVWKTQTLPPGHSHAFSVSSSQASSTVVMIRFDNRMGDNRLTFTTVRLLMIGTNEKYYGWRQNFIRVNDMIDVILAR